MAAISVAGVPLPLGDDFDFAAYMTRPADTSPPVSFDLEEINAENVAREKKNKASVKLTRAYSAAKAASTLAAGQDVGEPLLAFYEYTQEDRRLMVADRDVCAAVGPLPQFMILWIGTQRMNAQTARESDKDKREAERAALAAEKTKAVRPIFGTLTLQNPHAMSSYDATGIVIPSIYHLSLHHKIYFPFHWWADKYIKHATDNPHMIPTRSITAEQASALVAPQQVSVVDVAKLAETFGAEELKVLTPGLWRQAAKNMLDSFTLLCPAVVPGDPLLAHTHASEFAQHVVHFSRLPQFEDTEMLPVWYEVERELRNEIFRGGLYERSYHDTRINVAIATYRQANPETPTFTTIGLPVVNALKRASPDDGSAGSSKQARTGNGRGGRERSSTPASREGSVARERAPLAVEKDLRTAQSFRGNTPKGICISFNVGKKCSGDHGDARLHVCSLCGGEHAALTRDPGCARVHAGGFRP
ncbi:hypothetical protein C8R46DRAFT_1245622 [Mycena filopes]|nr:hypothetical protein C8R46DRAFT_1245622 [Mycena filopes]